MTTQIPVRASALDITPAGPVTLGASDNRSPLRSQRISSPIEADIILLGAHAAAVAIISLDVLFVGPDLERDLKRQLEMQGTPSAPEIILVATHTHFAPLPDRTKPRLGTVDDGWYRDLVSKLADALNKLLTTPAATCTVAMAQREVTGAIHRRRRVRRPVIHGRRLAANIISMGPNPRGPRNATARLAVFKNESNQSIAALVSWSCHPSARPVRDEVSPEFIGFARDALRRRLGPIPIVYLQGFSGDVRANVRTPITPARLLLRLLKGPVFMPPTEAEWRAWARQVGESIGHLADDPAISLGRFMHGSIVHEISRISLAHILDAPPPDRWLEARRVKLGEALELFFLSAEPSAEHAKQLTRKLPGAWPVGYLGDVFGYLPTNEQIAEGGYEVEGFRELFGLTGRFIGRNDQALEDLISQLSATGASNCR
jgi:hypothetical protein